MARADWYRLDNVGRFYSAQAGRTGQTVFRISADMADEIDPLSLQKALDHTVERYPGFNVSLRSGFFWHYLEPSGQTPKVHPENLPICFGLHVNRRSVLFRVSYYGTRINFEVSHIIADGRGALRFFEDLLAFYVAECRGQSMPVHTHDEDPEERTEDSYRENYDRSVAAPTPQRRAYHLPGPRLKLDPLYMEYHLSANKVLAWAHETKTSVTSLIIAAITCAICEVRALGKSTLPIRFDVPVDLRQYFDSATMRNFFGLAYVDYAPTDNPLSVDDVARIIQDQIVRGCAKDAVQQRMMRMVSLERNPFLRWAPVFMKDAVLGIATRIAKRDVTTTVSNLGRIKLDPAVARHVKSLSVLTAASGLNFTICSCEDDLCIGISTVLLHPDVLRNLCRIFSARGIEGIVNCNLDEHDVSRRLRDATFTGGLRMEGAAQ